MRLALCLVHHVGVRFARGAGAEVLTERREHLVHDDLGRCILREAVVVRIEIAFEGVRHLLRIGLRDKPVLLPRLCAIGQHAGLRDVEEILRIEVRQVGKAVGILGDTPTFVDTRNDLIWFALLQLADDLVHCHARREGVDPRLDTRIQLAEARQQSEGRRVAHQPRRLQPLGDAGGGLQLLDFEVLYDS